LGARIVEWFWRGASLAKQRELVPPASERAQVFARRARVSVDVANVAHTSVPLEPSHDAIASELYRQAAYWASCALSENREAASLEVEKVWAALDEALLAPPGGGVATAASLRELARTGSFAHFAELSSAEQLRARLSLRQLAETLLARFDERGAVLKALRAQRIWRLSLLALLVLGVAQGAIAVAQRRELAAGKPWRLSSDYGIGGCSSPEQQCPENGGYFFHTNVNDHSPWIEFDLAATQQISTVDVENRKDCCGERAIPLAVEVSTDHKHWRVVAQRDEVFSTWRASFPGTQARWVRLRVLKPGILHLNSVRIYR
jgi:F5/8 type C domain